MSTKAESLNALADGYLRNPCQKPLWEPKLQSNDEELIEGLQKINRKFILKLHFGP